MTLSVDVHARYTLKAEVERRDLGEDLQARLVRLWLVGK